MSTRLTSRGARFVSGLIAALALLALGGCVDLGQDPAAVECDCIPSDDLYETTCEGLPAETFDQWGVCEGAYQICQDGYWVDDYTAIPGWQEIEVTCDGFDNDCDGETDEGFEPVTCGQGECEHQSPTCVEGELVMCDPFEGAVAEVCGDGLDNDCDGETDEESVCPVVEE